MNSTTIAASTEIRKALDLIVAPGGIVEIRALHVPNGNWKPQTIAGYFSDLDKATEAAAILDKRKAGGVYVVLNKINPALFARSPNQLTDELKPTTSDNDISHRRWLPIDFDAERPAGISSTEDEHAASYDVARECATLLSSLGWPMPIFADSGNGHHLLYRIDLPRDDEGLVKNVLTAIAAKVGTPEVKVDLSVFNPARIWKLYGTTARKGHSLPERPHRQAQLIEVPDSVEVVSIEQLKKLAAAVKQPEPMRTASGNGNGQFDSKLDVPKWLNAKGISYRTKDGDGRKIYILEKCPFNEEHSSGEAAIYQSPDGKLGAGCKHNSCQGKDWQAFKNTIGKPDADDYDPPLNNGGEQVDISNILNQSSGKRTNSSSPVNETPSKPAKTEVSLTMREVLDFKPYPTDAFPEPIRGLIRAGSAALNVNDSFIGTAILPIIASAVGNLAVIELKPGWTEPSTLWAGFVGDSGTLKSPTLDIVMKHIRTRQAKAFTEYQKEQETYDSDKREYDVARKQTKKSELPPAEPAEPICKRYYCSDTTVEALADRLSQAPRGLLVCRDELSGWFASFDAYRGGKGSLDMSHWLGLYGARDLVIDRKIKESKTVFIKRGNVSIIGGIQPEILRRSLTAESYDSGLVSRLLLCWPPKRAKRWSEAVIADTLQAEVDKVFDFIYGLAPKLDSNDHIEPYILRLTRDAKHEWVRFYNRHAARQATASGYEAGILSKIEGAAARLALVIHFIRLAARLTDDFEHVDADSLRSGVILAEWYGEENLRVHAVIHSGDGDQEQRELLEWIQQNSGEVTARHLQQSVRVYRDGDTADQALQSLVAAGFGEWVDAPPTPKGGRPTRVFRLVSLALVNETPLTIENSEVSLTTDNVTPAYRPANHESAFDAFDGKASATTQNSLEWDIDDLNSQLLEMEEV